MFSSKSLNVMMMGGGLFASAAAAEAESVCISQECSQVAVQVEQLRAQVGNDHATIKKLQTDLILARQDISLLQNSGMNMNRERPAGESSRTANGHGR